MRYSPIQTEGGQGDLASAQESEIRSVVVAMGTVGFQGLTRAPHLARSGFHIE